MIIPRLFYSYWFVNSCGNFRADMINELTSLSNIRTLYWQVMTISFIYTNLNYLKNASIIS